MTTFLPINMDHPRAEIEMNFQKISTAPFMPRTERPVKREAQEQTQVLNTSGHQSENKRQAVDGSPNGHVKSSYSHAHPMSNRNGSREGSSTQSSAPEDAPNHESDGEHYGSENEGDAGDTAPPSKKKKGQRFYCKDFPPCNLSFTRSEHLARHIRFVGLFQYLLSRSSVETNSRKIENIRANVRFNVTVQDAFLV